VLLAASLAQAAPLRVAVTPVRPTEIGAQTAARVEGVLIEALQAMPSVTVSNLTGGKLSPLRRSEARLEGPLAARALALAHESGANRALAVEATPLGDGVVLYLQALEAPSGRTLGSTTVSLGAADERASLRRALTRLLDPAHYVGRLQLKVDVPGAELQIDGRKTPYTDGGSVALPVGTHALRVTHPAYRDLLRFIDIELDRTVTLDVPLAAYPRAEGEMTEQERRSRAAAPAKRLAWYRHWWAVAGVGVALTAVTAGIVWGVRAGISQDQTVPYTPKPMP
jgi:hypothetical protein